MDHMDNSSEHPRELLAHAIVASLQSWPESERRIFVEVRYLGKSSQDVAAHLGIQTAEVNRVLELCEIKLLRALKNLRDSAPPESGHVSSSPPAYGVGCYFR